MPRRGVVGALWLRWAHDEGMGARELAIRRVGSSVQAGTAEAMRARQPQRMDRDEA